MTKKKRGTLFVSYPDDKFYGKPVFYKVEHVTSYEEGKALLLEKEYKKFSECVFEKDAFHVFRKFLKEHPEVNEFLVDVYRLPYASELKDYKMACYYDELEDMERGC